MQHIRIIAVDIDGIITQEKNVTEKEVPNQININKINLLFDSNVIILYTSRDISLKYQTINQMKEFGVKYHDIIFNKLQYDVIVDDKAKILEDL
jgi:hypothetical protein